MYMVLIAPSILRKNFSRWNFCSSLYFQPFSAEVEVSLFCCFLFSPMLLVGFWPSDCVYYQLFCCFGVASSLVAPKVGTVVLMATVTKGKNFLLESSYSLGLGLVGRILDLNCLQLGLWKLFLFKLVLYDLGFNPIPMKLSVFDKRKIIQFDDIGKINN